MRSFVKRNNNWYRDSIVDALPIFTHVLTAILLRCYARLGRRHCDVTDSQRSHCASFEHVQNLEATSATLDTSLRSAVLSWDISQRPSGDLADFADRSEVAILCDWGIMAIKHRVDIQWRRRVCMCVQWSVLFVCPSPASNYRSFCVIVTCSY